MIYFFPYVTLAVSMYGFYLMGNFVWIATLILFVCIPIIEILTKNKKFNPAQHKSNWGTASLVLTPFILTPCLLYSFFQMQKATTWLELLGLSISMGVLIGAFGITSAHELVHRRQKIYRALGVWNLILCNFAHWGIEHVYGHHKNVATPHDPATARKNEWIYTFWVRTYIGVLRGAWTIAKQKVLAYWLLSLILSVIIYFVFGPKVLGGWWIASLFAISLLQTVDYIEHYGLLRSKNEDGLYSAVKAHHAWDTASVATNVHLFNLGLHSHHHMKASIPFQDLSEQPGHREMPFGYSVMVVMALFPFLYIPYMNKRLT